jgi:hypothetical protein
MNDDLRFAAAFGDTAIQLVRAAAAARGYEVELEEPDRPVSYDSRVILRHVAAVPELPQLFPFDPYHGLRLTQAAQAFGVRLEF